MTPLSLGSALRKQPLTALGRGAKWAALIALGRTPSFPLLPGVTVSVPARPRRDSLAAFVMRDGICPELLHLDRIVEDKGVVVDVGAGIGMFALKAAARAGRVVAVEPDPETAAALLANLELSGFSNVVVVRKALGAGPEPGGPVPVTSLDCLAGQLGLPRIDCIRIGATEGRSGILAGARAVIAAHHPVVVLAGKPPAQGGDDGAGEGMRDARARLSALGYHFFRLAADGAAHPLADRPADGTIIARHPADGSGPCVCPLGPGHAPPAP